MAANSPTPARDSATHVPRRCNADGSEIPRKIPLNGVPEVDLPRTRSDESAIQITLKVVVLETPSSTLSPLAAVLARRVVE
jgi:hypothetical protein